MKRNLSSLLLSLLLCGCASTLPPAPLTAATTEALSTDVCQEGLRELVAWIPRLKLNAWEIVYHCELPPTFGDQADGEIKMQLEKLQADIWINPSSTRPGEAAVHEPLHILLYWIRVADSDLIDEQMVRTLTRALRGGGEG